MSGKYVIFSIDNHNDPVVYNQFLNMVHNHALRKHNVVGCVGAWQGVTERSFIMHRDDFELIVDADWYAGQEAILWVTECNKQYATLEFADGTKRMIGCMKHVSQAEALAQEGWTYRPDQDRYFTVVPGNNDTIPGVAH